MTSFIRTFHLGSYSLETTYWCCWWLLSNSSTS